MAEEQRGSQGRKHYSQRKPASRDGRGFKPRNGGNGKSYGGDHSGGYHHGSGGFQHRDASGDERRRGGEAQGEPQRHRTGNGRRFGNEHHGTGAGRPDKPGNPRYGRGGGRGFHRDAQKDGDRPRRDYRDRQDRERGDSRRSDEHDGFHRGGGHGEIHRNGGRGGFHRDGPRRYDADREGRNATRTNTGEGAGRTNDTRRGSYQGGERRDTRGGKDRRDFHGDDNRREYRQSSDRRNQRSGSASRGSYRHDGDRRDFHRDNGFRRDDDRSRDTDRRRDNDRRGGGFRRAERTSTGNRGAYRDDQRPDQRHNQHERLNEPRRNSDGTISFPSQNPYTDRRPDEPRMPRGMEWSMLSKDEKERLRGLAKEHAENIGLHILAAFSLEESDAKASLEHAKWVARQASRIDFARETLAFIAYRQGDYKLALREFRTAYRMNGYADYLPFIADCERGVGEPKKAIELTLCDEAKAVDGEAKAELFLVYAGALADLKLWDKAIDVVHKLAHSKGLFGAYRMRAVQAEQLFLEQAGRLDEAAALDDLLDRLEAQYADDDEDDENGDEVVVDYDLEQLPPDLMQELGISDKDAEYAADADDYDGTGEAGQPRGDGAPEVPDGSDGAKKPSGPDDPDGSDGERRG